MKATGSEQSSRSFSDADEARKPSALSLIEKLARDENERVAMSWEAKRAFAEAASRSYSYSVRREASRSSNFLDSTSQIFDDCMEQHDAALDLQALEHSQRRRSDAKVLGDGVKGQGARDTTDVNALIQQLHEQAMQERFHARESDARVSEWSKLLKKQGASPPVGRQKDQEGAVKTHHQEVQTEEMSPERQNRSDIAGVLKETLHELSMVRSRLQKEQATREREVLQHKDCVSELNVTIKNLHQQVSRLARLVLHV
eukprot:751172-Hanusia_phi.AAC.9